MRRNLLLALMGLLSIYTYSQSCSTTSKNPWQWPSHRNWFFAPNGWTGMVRNMSTSTNTSVGVVGTVPVTSYEGVSAASDDSGNLLFYTNGRKIWTGTGASTVLKFGGVMEGNEQGSTNMANGSAAQGIITVRHPLNPNNYYIFTTDDAQGTTLGFNYVVVNNTGAVVSPAARLGGYRSTEGVAATWHANGVDIWITTCGSGTSQFYTYLLKCNGLVTTPVVSPAPSISGQQERGGVAFSWDSKYFASAHPNNWPNEKQAVSIYKFNNATGAITDEHAITPGGTLDTPYDVVFSPDNSKVYVSGQNTNIFYYDITSWNVATMSASRTSTGVTTGYSAIEIGADGNLYTVVGGSLVKTTGSLNAGGAFTSATVAGTAGQASYGLPTMFLPPQEEPDIQEVGPYCNTDAPVDLSTKWLCSGLDAEDPSGNPASVYTASCGACITAGTGVFSPSVAGAGTHRIIFTKCSVDDTIFIVVNTCSCPDTTLKNPKPICAGSKIDLDTMRITTVTGNWTIQGTPGANWPTLAGTVFTTNSNTAGGSYVVRYTLNPAPADPSCPKYAERTIVVNAKPNITLTDTTICSGSPNHVFNPGSGYTSYNWNAGLATTPTYSTKTAGLYTVIVTTNKGCKDTASATLTVNAKPNITLRDTAICNGGTPITLDAGAGFTTYAWTPTASSSQTKVTSNTVGATYQVIVTDAKGCKDTAQSIITINARPNISLTDTAICAGSPAHVFSPGAGYTSYNWNNGLAATSSYSTTIANTYTVIVTDAKGCKDTASAILTVNVKPNITLRDSAICQGSSAVVLDAGAGFSNYNWDNGAGATQTFSTGIAGPHSVIVTDNKGCKDTANNVLTVSAKPNITLRDTAICEGTTPIVLDAGAGYANYNWNNSTITTSTRSTSNTLDGVYIVIVTDSKGCKDTAQSTITINSRPTISMQDTTVCEGSPAHVFSPGAGYTSYNWNNGLATTSSYSTTTANTYTVIVSDAKGCKDTASAVLTVNVRPNITLADTAICQGAPAKTFKVSGTFSAYNWNNGASTLATYSTNIGGPISVIVTDNKGCKDTANATLTVNPKPNITIADKEICTNGAAATFDAGAGYTYKWVSGETTQTISKTTAATYTVEVTDNKGCKDTASANLTVNALPVVSLGPDQTICPGSTATLDAGAGFTTYSWLPNGETSQTIGATTANNYIVTVTNAKGCAKSDTLVVNVNANLSINLGPDKEICAGDSTTFTVNYAAAGVTYTWDNGASTKTITVKNAATYNVHVQDPMGCQGDGTVKLTVNSLPTPTLTPGIICAGASYTFDAGNYSAYSWSSGEITKTINKSVANNYTVTVTDAKGCKNSASATLTVNNNPVVAVGNDYTGCGGTSATFDAGNTGSTYLWSNAQTTQSILVLTDGQYSVVVTDVNGCKGYDTATATFIVVPQLEIGEDIHICPGESASITAIFNPPSSVLTWSTGQTGTTINVSSAGKIIATANNGGMCSAIDSLQVIVDDIPKVVTMNDTTVCFLQLPNGLTLDAGGTADLFTWSNGTTGQTNTVTSEGVYSVKLTNEYGCTASTSVTISEDCPSSLFVPNAFSPNEDGLNDVFQVKGENIYDFDLYVFDRWGEMIFHSSDMANPWNGKRDNNMRDAQIDVYVWKVTYKYWIDKHEGGALRQQVGTVTIIK